MTKTIGITSGCFNLLHPGHVWFLNQCKKLCNELIVLVARDKITSQKRVPVMNEEQRHYMIKNLECVDMAFFEDEKIPPNNIKGLLEDLEPDFYFTNTDNPNLEVYKKICKKLKTEVVIMERHNEGIFDMSTTETIDKIKKGERWDL